VSLDSVSHAAATPEKDQPYEALGLKDNEYALIKEILGRRPTSGELAMYSVMWSEHCSYKSSKIHLRQFGAKVTPEMTKKLLVGMGENAGVVDVGEGWQSPSRLKATTTPVSLSPSREPQPESGGLSATLFRWGRGLLP